MGKGSEFLRRIQAKPLRAGERRPGESTEPRPTLRLRPDRTIEVDDATTLDETLAAIKAGEIRNALLENRAAERAAVLVPIERYLGLIATELATSQDVVALPDGRLEPSDLATSEVEQIDPNATW